MASRRLVPASAREALLGIPSDTASLERNYLLADEDLDLIGTRRRPENGSVANLTKGRGGQAGNRVQFSLCLRVDQMVLN